MSNMTEHKHANCSKCIDHWWSWAQNQSVQPIKGFRDKVNPNGTRYSYIQQKKATKFQIYLIICDLCRRGKSSASIQSIITAFL
jgi:hypothetical protein